MVLMPEALCFIASYELEFVGMNASYQDDALKDVHCKDRQTGQNNKFELSLRSMDRQQEVSTWELTI